MCSIYVCMFKYLLKNTLFVKVMVSSIGFQILSVTMEEVFSIIFRLIRSFPKYYSVENWLFL